MSSSSDEEVPKFVFYKDRPEWKDVQPVPQDDGEEPVVAIDYDPEFKDVFDYFRAIVQKGEKSERALELTETATRLNAANYTVWQYRREILKALNKDLHEELDSTEKVILNHSKNYQVWQHRRIIVEWLKDASKEKYLTERVLAKDAKNYHAWQHRQWAIKSFSLYDGELTYVEQLIADDVRNNSAWNQRYFVINNTTGFTEEVVKTEIEYTLGVIRTVTMNESSWNYLRGLLLHDKSGLSENPQVTQFCEELFNSGNRSPFLLAMIVDMCYEQVSKDKEHPLYNIQRAKELCDNLATVHDTIRSKYWEYMGENIGKGSEACAGDAPNFE